MNTSSTFSIAKFPMGPHIRKWLSVDDSAYKGFENSAPSSSDVVNFSEYVLDKLSDIAPAHSDQLVDLLEELVGMNLPLLAIKLVDANPTLFPIEDFRAQLHLGNASMLVSDLARAEIAFTSAQKLVPEEPAPYVNLTQIYCHDGMIEQARSCCLAGLNIEPNHLRLWEMLAWIEQEQAIVQGQEKILAAETVGALATKLNSWAGTSLYYDLTAPEDVLKKLHALEKFWNEGLKSPDFIVEFTANLGMAGQYDRVPSVIWQFEKDQENQKDKQKGPWQIYMHLVQSYMGLGRDDDAQAALKKLNTYNDLPDSAQQALAMMMAEMNESKLLN